MSFKKKFEVIRSSPRKDPVTVGGKDIFSDRKNVAYIDDAGVAAEVEARYGRTGDDDLVRVIPVDDWQADPSGLHHYTFKVRGLPECACQSCKRLPTDEFYPYCSKSHIEGAMANQVTGVM